MYIRAYESYGDSGHNLLSNSNLYPNCQPPSCPGSDTDHNPAPATNGTAPPSGRSAATAQQAVTDSITRFGQGNFIGVVVFAVLVFVALILWMTSGMWPRTALARLRVKLRRRRAGRKGGRRGGDAKGGSALGTQMQEVELGQCVETAAGGEDKPLAPAPAPASVPEQDNNSDFETGQRQAGASSSGSIDSLGEKLGGDTEKAEEQTEETVPHVRFA